ncbi:MAG: DUF1501 domain-containing protein [Verrucomicrobiota bacterium]
MNPIKRRKFLQSLGNASIAAMAAGAPRPSTAAPPLARYAPSADSMILLWMGGGMAHTDTFDPKRYTPFTKGVEAKSVLSTFPSIDSAVDSIKLSQGLENIASIMDRGTLIRSHVLADLGHILHSRHQYHWHTGYKPPLTVAAPHLGSWMSHILGSRNEALPSFIEIGQSYAGNGEAEELKAFSTGGCLGSEHGPFRISDPADAIKSVRPPAGMTFGRFQNRDKALRRMLAASPLAEYGSDFQKDSYLSSLDKAYRLLSSPAAEAFDLSKEPRNTYNIYNTGKFGQGCLLARRLVEKGARFVEVSTDYEPFKGWDTHDNGHTRLKQMKRMIDAPITQLILDLEKRGLLDRTLVVLASEFSRDMMTEGKPGKEVRAQAKVQDKIQDLKFYGMHRHFTAASSVLMFGGGVKQGLLYGETADERPCTTVSNAIGVMDLHATIYRAMGIRSDYSVDIEKRPFYVTNLGQGKVRKELLDKV